MSRTWKWILGITLGLVILAGLGFITARYFGFGHMSFWGGPAFYGHPMMGGRGLGILSFPFFFLGGFMRLLFPLAVVALVAYIAYQQGKRAGMNAGLGASKPEPEDEIAG